MLIQKSRSLANLIAANFYLYHDSFGEGIFKIHHVESIVMPISVKSLPTYIVKNIINKNISLYKSDHMLG